LKLPYHTPKLAPRRQGPFHISLVISPVAYRLVLPLSWGIHNVFHASLLLPYKETTVHGPNFTRPPPDLIEGEEEYEVEAVVNHRRHGRWRQLQYLIKWRGYPPSDNTWETAEDMHMDDLVKEYHRCHPLELLKDKTSRGTKRLARTLQLFATTPSPTQKVTTWLLNGAHPMNPPHILTDSQLGSKSLLRALSHLSVSPSSESCRKLSLALASTTHGGSFKMSPTSCANFGNSNEESDLRRVSLKMLGQALKMSTTKKTAPTLIRPKMPSCTTVPPSGHGHPL